MPNANFCLLFGRFRGINPIPRLIARDGNLQEFGRVLAQAALWRIAKKNGWPSGSGEVFGSIVGEHVKSHSDKRDKDYDHDLFAEECLGPR